MGTLSRDAVLNDARDLFNFGVVANLTDGQLLDRIKTHDSEQAARAFSALVERHGAMVLRVCRQRLGDPHDAEDAFQATFLVLLRKAHAIRKPRSCGSWLHGVAVRSAVALRAAAAQRKRHERRAAESQGATRDSDGLSVAEDLRWVLDDELGRLQERFRAPLVLCYLEGRTCEDAARQLGWPVGTVKSRLARGRERLRQRLVRRGLAPALGLAAKPDLPSLARETVTPALVTKVSAAAARAAAGTAVGTSVLAIVRVELRRTLLGRVAQLGAALAGVGIAVLVLGLAAAGHDDAPAPQAAAPSANVDNEPVHLRVVDREGKPVGDVTVRVFAKPGPARTVTADAEGRVVVPRDQVDEFVNFLATRGDSIGWASADLRPPRQSGTPAHPSRLVLLPVNHTVEGSIVDPNGRPIAGVRLVVEAVSRVGQLGVFLPYLEMERQGWPLGSALTDEAGRYRLTLPEETNAGLHAIHPRFSGPWIAANHDARTIDPAALEPAGRIIGKVTDVQTGAPVAGARLGAQLLDHEWNRVRRGYGETSSDARGEFALGGLEPGVYNLHVWGIAGREQAAAAAVEAVRVRALEDARADLVVVPGRPLRGIVIDSQTNQQPVPGVRVGCYGPAHPRTGAAVESQRTDAKGAFAFFVPPGEQYVYVMDGASYGRLSRSVVVVPERGELEPVRLIRQSEPARPSIGVAKAQVRRMEVVPAAVEVKQSVPKSAPARPESPAGRTVTGQVTDREGRPLAGVAVAPNTLPSAPGAVPHAYDSAATDRTGVFILRNAPRHAFTLNFSRPEGDHDAVFSRVVEADEEIVEFVFPPNPAQARPGPPEPPPAP